MYGKSNVIILKSLFSGNTMQQMWRKDSIKVEQFLWTVDEILDISHDLRILEFEREYTFQLSSLSFDIALEFEEKQPFSLPRQNSLDAIDLLLQRKSEELSSCRNTSDDRLVFVDLIDDNNSDKIWSAMVRFRKSRSLKRLRNVAMYLSKDDMSMGSIPNSAGMRATLSFASPDSNTVYVGAYGTKAD